MAPITDCSASILCGGIRIICDSSIDVPLFLIMNYFDSTVQTVTSAVTFGCSLTSTVFVPTALIG